jgi:hypothetical protein
VLLLRLGAYRLLDRCSNCDLLLDEPRWRPWWWRRAYCGAACREMVRSQWTAL